MKSFDLTRIQIQHEDPVLAMGLAAVLRRRSDRDVNISGIDPEPNEPPQIVIADHRRAVQLAMVCSDRRERPSLMAVGTQDRERDIRLALEAGVSGVLLAGCRLDELEDAVNTLKMGSRYVCRSAAQKLAESLGHESLTTRETDVLRLLAKGLGNKAIARELCIAVGTVKTHVKAILDKLDACTRTQAADVAAKRGLVDAPALQAAA
ncbi:response regulator transcription factor [Roseateles sp.]|uniref:response regulator transcription factor n=1 Tax=Roseateles sp. TaxID=1971397 RepID=UPI0039EB982C